MATIDWRPVDFLPFFALFIPIVAIIGGITAGIIRAVGRQRLMELVQRERIAAIERGVDPSKLPPPPLFADDWQGRSPARVSQGLMVSGVIVLAAGLGLGLFLRVISEDGGNAWAVGLIPIFVGLALLISSWLVRPPKGTNGGPLSPTGS